MQSLNVIPASFDCDRTCPLHRTHWCRFNALFTLIGSARVHSHTVKITVPYRDPKTLKKACDALKWEWIGDGTHTLFDGAKIVGNAFKPQGWYYPAVLDAAGELHSDTYNGQWGDDRQLDKLKSEYALATAQIAAEELGWQCERTDTGLTIYHPENGVLTVSKEGVCETTGFIGAGCHAAREALGLMADGAIQNKPEYGAVAAVVQAGG
jgi:hypothetical protein